MKRCKGCASCPERGCEGLRGAPGRHGSPGLPGQRGPPGVNGLPGAPGTNTLRKIERYFPVGTTLFVVPEDVNSILVTLVSGGGGGAAMSLDTFFRSGGAGGGAFFTGTFPLGTGLLEHTLTVVVGDGGNPGFTLQNSSGSAGGPTSISNASATIVATISGGNGGISGDDKNQVSGGTLVSLTGATSSTVVDGQPSTGSAGGSSLTGQGGNNASFSCSSISLKASDTNGGSSFGGWWSSADV